MKLDKLKRNGKDALLFLAGFATVALVITIIFFVACGQGILVSDDSAVRALETQGFTDVKITGHNYFFLGMRGGSKDDDVRFVCEATNPRGQRVTVYVFAGWPFKAATIRTP